MKIVCPHHKQGQERTPSLHLYPDGGEFCYACGHYKRGTGKFNAKEETEETEASREALRETIQGITGLPTKGIRGFNLPFNSAGYYIVWPSNDYYKFRFQGDPGLAGKYKNPPGIKKPLLAYIQRKTDLLWIVEGEINAMSLREVELNDDIVSPGPVTDFCRNSYLTQYEGYDKVVIVVDKDAPGAKAAIKLKAKLVQHTPEVHIELLERDLNQILCDDGREGLRKTYMELRTRLRLDQGSLRPSGLALNGTGRENSSKEQKREDTNKVYG